MIEDQISAIIEAHYAAEHAGVLLLSKLGERLVKEQLWPLERSDRRTLYQIVEAMRGFALVSDPKAKAFIAVVKQGDEQRARDAIEARKKLFFLRGLPRPLLLAFTLDIAPGQSMFLSLDPKPEYRAGPDGGGAGFTLVESEFRLPGLDASDLDELAPSDSERLEANIRGWAERHEVDLTTAKRRSISARQTPALPVGPTTALERLYAAQTPDVAKRMTIPIDIALALSRMS